MDGLMSSPLVDAFPSPRFDSEAPSPTQTEVDLPAEVDQSFNSSLSISSADHSPLSLSPLTTTFVAASPVASDAVPKKPTLSPLITQDAFLSPSPATNNRSRRPDPVPLQSRSRSSLGSVYEGEEPCAVDEENESTSRSSFSLAGRSFGRELSVNQRSSYGPNSSSGKSTIGKGMMLPPAVPENGRLFASRSRGGIPMQWTSSNEERQSPRMMKSSMTRRESAPSSVGPSPKSIPVRSNDLMDVDSPRPSSSNLLFQQSPSTFGGASSFSGSPGLGSFFCDSPSAPAAALPSKRRSLVGSSPASPSSSPSAKRASLAQSRVMEKAASTSSAMLFGVPRSNTIAARRGGGGQKRPQLLPVAHSGDMTARSTSTNSAYPILYASSQSDSSSASLSVSSSEMGNKGAEPINDKASGSSAVGPAVRKTMMLGQTLPRASIAPMRRAFSVCDQPQIPHALEMSEDESSEFDASPSIQGAGAAATAAAYARRHGARVVSRPDGSPGFKPMRSTIAMSGDNAQSPVRDGSSVAGASAMRECAKASPYGPGGLPGFGDNEMDGKILPCHKVKEDGLVRISHNTMQDLLAGKYDSKIRRYHILDCRFDYEYEGGHIAGAINVKSIDQLDQLLLSASGGVHANGESLPSPSRSGESDEGQQVVLIFHCEFSAKRAPTFAKHLRSRDRLINGAIYPKIYYPELYILQGGYHSFYKAYPNHCHPQAYVPMDDPRHFVRRNSDLHDFRKFTRTRSFPVTSATLNDATQQLNGGFPAASGILQSSAIPRAIGPPPQCPPLAFAAASVAVGRRTSPGTEVGLLNAEGNDNDYLPLSRPRIGAINNSLGLGMGDGGCNAAGSGGGGGLVLRPTLGRVRTLMTVGSDDDDDDEHNHNLHRHNATYSQQQFREDLTSDDMESDSPCARVTQQSFSSNTLNLQRIQAPIFGSAKSRTLGVARARFGRVASYAGSTSTSTRP